MLRLRQKLELYFSEEGRDEPLRIAIPRGRYVAVFQPVRAERPAESPLSEEPTEVTTAEPEPATPATAPQGFFARQVSPSLGTLLCTVAAALVAVAWFAGLHLQADTQPPATRQFWKQMSSRRSPTLLVAADSGLVLLHGITGQNTTLQEYVTHDLLMDKLTHVPEAVPSSYRVRYARDLSMDDLKNSDVILSGSRDANPWVAAFEPQMNFTMQIDLHGGVRAFLPIAAAARRTGSL